MFVGFRKNWNRDTTELPRSLLFGRFSTAYGRQGNLVIRTGGRVVNCLIRIACLAGIKGKGDWERENKRKLLPSVHHCSRVFLLPIPLSFVRKVGSARNDIQEFKIAGCVSVQANPYGSLQINTLCETFAFLLVTKWNLKRGHNQVNIIVSDPIF